MHRINVHYDEYPPRRPEPRLPPRYGLPPQLLRQLYDILRMGFITRIFSNGANVFFTNGTVSTASSPLSSSSGATPSAHQSLYKSPEPCYNVCISNCAFAYI